VVLSMVLKWEKMTAFLHPVTVVVVVVAPISSRSMYSIRGNGRQEDK